MTGTSNNKRIFKNTVVLYIRMIVVLFISLYTSRFVLKALGVDDFGLYNVVGGVVGLLTFFNGTMLKASQRFLNIAMVKGSNTLRDIFSSSVTVHVIIAIVFLIFSETIGLWFLNFKVIIPEDRVLAANAVYQASVFSFCMSILTIPYSAAVVAYEKMDFLAVVSIVDAILKLGVAIGLLAYSEDRLILYGFLLFAITALNFLLYYSYCKKKYPILSFRISYNIDNFKQIFSFVSWTLLGQMSVVGCNQGNIVLVNMFHSLAANAAMSVGSQVNAAIANLTTNFQTAFNPQITKSFAEANYSYLRNLVFVTSKISFCIMLLVALPVAFNIDWLLQMWLDDVPFLSNVFAILFMVNGVINAISTPFNYTVLSSGKIRNFQVATAIAFLLDLPITYVLFSIGLPATTVLWVKIGIMIVVFFIRVYFASIIVNTINFYSVLREVVLPVIITVTFSVSFAFLLDPLAKTIGDRLLLTVVLEIVCIVMIWILCLNKEERASLFRLIKRKNNRDI